jgi:sugar phosphate isomerase/epimerase
MKLGVSTFAWTSQFEARHLGLLPVVREMRMEALEVPLFQPQQLAEPEIRRAFAAHDLECTVCAILPDSINPISPDAAVRALRATPDGLHRNGGRVRRKAVGRSALCTDWLSAATSSD